MIEKSIDRHEKKDILKLDLKSHKGKRGARERNE